MTEDTWTTISVKKSTLDMLAKEKSETNWDPFLRALLRAWRLYVPEEKKWRSIRSESATLDQSTDTEEENNG